MSILIVDDEPQILDVVSAYLEEQGYSVVKARTGLDALRQFELVHPELIVLDLMLPKLDGLAVAERIREVSRVPIIMLTAKGAEQDRVRGLELGADDYIVKPFSPRELLARIEAVLRRSGNAEEGQKIVAGDLEIDINVGQVLRGGLTIVLTPIEFKLLATLARHPHRIFSRLQLLEAVQDSTFDSLARTIDSHIKNLRKKLEPNTKSPIYIQTAYGTGYRFVPQSKSKS